MAVVTEATINTPAPVTVAWYANLFAAGTDQPRVREVGLFNTSSTTAAVQTQWIRTTARGTQTTSLAPGASNQLLRSDRVTVSVIDSVWSANPTNDTNAMRMCEIAGTVGSFVIWTWAQDGEPTILAGAGIAWFNASGATGPILRAYWNWEA